MIRTKSIFQPSEEEDGMRVLITRFYPQGIKKEHFDCWIRDLSPNSDLLQAYRHDLFNWETFKSAFLRQLKESIDSWEAIFALHDLSVSTDITLLCYERDRQPCHRHLVRDIVECPELLFSLFIPKDTDNKKRVPMERLITH